LATLERAAMTPSRLSQRLQIIKRFVSHRVPLQIVPDILNGIQLRSVGREVFRSPVFLMGDIGLNDSRPMGQETIPYQDDRSVNVTAQMMKER